MSTVGAIRGLALSCHPGPTVAVTTFTALLAASAGHPLPRGLLVTAAVFAGQLSIGWSNDLIDASRDRAEAAEIVDGARVEIAARHFKLRENDAPLGRVTISAGSRG